MQRFIVEIVTNDPAARRPVRVGPRVEITATGLAEAGRKFLAMLNLPPLDRPRLALRVRRISG